MALVAIPSSIKPWKLRVTHSEDFKIFSDFLFRSFALFEASVKSRLTTNTKNPLVEFTKIIAKRFLEHEFIAVM